MNSRELLLKALRNETTPRPAWVPFVGVHGAKLLGKTAREYLQSSELMLAGLRRARELYQPDGLPVAFDLQLEAEVLGCELHWADQPPPSVCTHPLEQGKSLVSLPVFDPSMGRFPLVMDTLRAAKKEMGDDIALYGLLCGPFTLALHLMGNEIFLQMFDHPDYVKAVIGFCASVGQKVAQAYLDNGADVIAVVDPMTSQISSEHFDLFVTPAVNQIFAHVHDRKALSSLFVCGDATRNLEAMCRTNCDNISIDENIALERIRDFTRGRNKSFGGNLKLTSVLLLGDEEDAQLDAIRCIDVGGGCGFVLAPGCDLPFNTPEKNLMAISGMVHDSYRREVAKRTIIAKTAEHAFEVPLPDYVHEPHVTIDVITLDSASCAPCQYMMEAVHRAAKHLSQPVIVKEHRITSREGIGVMTRLGVKNIPTICLDGIVAFSSIIPDQNTLVAAIEAKISEKKKK
ncbi:MAG: uroporphyrinogen decarboxylase family protein [Kiritimatiellaeota bacterium]|nr:uroporphyrinogen decarboxylase family protein [Kiritimatiellota bacterium]